MDYISRLYNLHVEHNLKLDRIKQDYITEKEGLELIKELKYNKLIEALNDYKHYTDNIYTSINHKLLDNYLK